MSTEKREWVMTQDRTCFLPIFSELTVGAVVALWTVRGTASLVARQCEIAPSDQSLAGRLRKRGVRIRGLRCSSRSAPRRPTSRILAVKRGGLSPSFPSPHEGSLVPTAIRNRSGAGLGPNAARERKDEMCCDWFAAELSARYRARGRRFVSPQDRPMRR